MLRVCRLCERRKERRREEDGGVWVCGKGDGVQVRYEGVGCLWCGDESGFLELSDEGGTLVCRGCGG